MKNSRKYIQRMRGFSLIELMVSMVIGLIMLLAVSYFLLGSQRSSQSHDDSSRMQENARNVLDSMGRAIRQAGYPAKYNSTNVFTALAGTDNTITVRYEAQVGGETDCTGTNRAAGSVIEFIFEVNASNQLTCNNGTDTVVLADQVESIQLTYGLDGERDGVIDSYKSASAVANFKTVAVVKVVLTMRGANAKAATGGDGYLRQIYSASYTLRNQAG